jgi:hypothetical protein
LSTRPATTEPAILEALLLQAAGQWRTLERLDAPITQPPAPLAAALLNALRVSPLQAPEQHQACLDTLAQLDPHAACALALSRGQLALAQEQLLLGETAAAATSLRQGLASSVNAVASTGMPIPAHLADQLLNQAGWLGTALASQLDLALASRRGQLPAQLVLVLGMHRSGTSALSGLLVQAGLDGPRDLMPATQANPRGYWESLGEVALSDQLLQQLGSHWSRCWALAHHDWDSNPTAVQGWRSGLLHLLSTTYAHGGRAVLKDPRLCVLLPALQPWLESSLISCAAFLPVRHPAEVASSLRVAEGLPRRQALLLWLGHVLHAERNSRALQRLIVDYQKLLANPQAVLASAGRVLELAGDGLPLPQTWSIEEASGFIDPQLQRQRAGEDVPSWVLDEQAEVWYDLALGVHAVMVDPQLSEPQRSAALDQYWQQWTTLAP